MTAVRPSREDFGAWRTATTRWADIDVYGHMNNARYFELIDTAVNAHLAQATGTDIRRLDAVGVVAEVSCRYFAEVDYPDPLELGLAVERIGTSSIVYRIGIFQRGADGRGELAAAEGRFVHVYVDNAPAARPAGGGPRSTRPVPEAIREAVAELPGYGAPDV